MGIYDHPVLNVIEHEDQLSMALLEACQVILRFSVPWFAVSPSYAEIGDARRQSTEQPDDWPL